MRSRVLVVGGGPVGLTTALLLARHGLRVTLVERDEAQRRCVRTVALDDESLRIWQACGLEQRLMDDWDGGPAGELVCQYLTPAGRVFLGLRRCEGDLGYPQAVAVHEGRIAATLASVAARHPDIDVLQGRSVVALAQDADGVFVDLQADDGTTTRERADWVVACDGGHSTVRGLLGIDMRGETLEASWLVANVEEDEPVLHATIRCDPRRPSVMVSVPHGVRRIECLLQPN
ncbi:MAG: FAD-dependent oxidoreductase, partial [bacterium]